MNAVFPNLSSALRLRSTFCLSCSRLVTSKPRTQCNTNTRADGAFCGFHVPCILSCYMWMWVILRLLPASLFYQCLTSHSAYTVTAAPTFTTQFGTLKYDPFYTQPQRHFYSQIYRISLSCWCVHELNR